MPIYEYHCKHCDHQFEVMQSMSEAAIRQCPQCNRNEVIKLISATSFKLMGTGWYATDSKEQPKDKSKDRDKPDKEPAKESVKEPAKEPATVASSVTGAES